MHVAIPIADPIATPVAVAYAALFVFERKKQNEKNFSCRRGLNPGHEVLSGVPEPTKVSTRKYWGQLRRMRFSPERCARAAD